MKDKDERDKFNALKGKAEGVDRLITQASKDIIAAIERRDMKEASLLNKQLDALNKEYREILDGMNALIEKNY